MIETLTPNDQERALIAMLHALDARRLEKGKSAPSYIMIKLSYDYFDDGSAMTLGWTVGLILDGAFNAEASGATFAGAWDAMVSDGDAKINHVHEIAKKRGWDTSESVTTLSDLVRHWRATTTPLTAQETELIMNLRRRAAKKDDYLIFLAVNDEEHPGEWEVTEKKEVCGNGITFAAAWDEKF